VTCPYSIDIRPISRRFSSELAHLNAAGCLISTLHSAAPTRTGLYCSGGLKQGLHDLQPSFCCTIRTVASPAQNHQPTLTEPMRGLVQQSAGEPMSFFRIPQAGKGISLKAVSSALEEDETR